MKHLPLSRSSAFTRADLMALLGSVTFLAVLFITSAGTTRRGAQTVVCRNNLQRLANAWLLYAGENRQLVGNILGGNASSADPRKAQTWATGWLDWGNSRQNTNTATLQTAAFGRYIGTDLAVFRCPSDNFLSAGQRNLGWIRRVRSYSMNCYVGPSTLEEGPTEPGFVHFRSPGEVTRPDQIFVFAEEHPDSMNDPMLLVSARAAQYIDLPASFHSREANFAFADGHLESHRWASDLTVQPVRILSFGGIASPPGNPDLLWLASHATRAQ